MALTHLDILLRDMGSLGSTWKHRWQKGNSDALVKTGLPLDESSKIFNRETLQDGRLLALIDIAYGPCSEAAAIKERSDWKKMMKHYVDALHYMSLSREYDGDDVQQMAQACDAFSVYLIEICGGINNVTNYFHDIVSGHVVEQSEEWGNLMRYRNEGVELFNAMVSRRRNCFSNLGGHKRVRSGAAVAKFQPVESLGKWCCRLGGWQTGIADEALSKLRCTSVFKSKSVQYDSEKKRFNL